MKTYPTVGACGLDCGLCPRYYTAGPSRCPGCGGPDFASKHPSCSFLTCCVKKKGLESCGQCPEFPCAKFKREAEYRQVPLSSSYPPYRVLFSNLTTIRDRGIKPFVRQQQERIRLLEAMLAGFDDDRSKSFYCRAAALLDPSALRKALKTASDAQSLRSLLNQAAALQSIELKSKK